MLPAELPGTMTPGLREGAFLGIEVEADHALGGIGAMAGEAVIGEDGADSAIKIDGGRGGVDGERREEKNGARFHVVWL